MKLAGKRLAVFAPVDLQGLKLFHPIQKNGDDMRLNKSAFLLIAFVMLYSNSATAQLSFHDAVTNQGVLDRVIQEFSTRAQGWQTIIMAAASRLYWSLALISLAWTFGMMALSKADIGEFFAELVRFTIFTGFFWWLLINGPNFASAIYASLRQLGESAIGINSVSPSGIVDIGFMIWKQAVANLSIWSPVDSFVGVALSAGILILLAMVAVNMLLLLVSGWILAYAGIIFLGFGGSRWTSDMAISYYKTVLGVAAQLMAMVLLVGIGHDLLATFYNRMNKGTLNFDELGVMLVFCLALVMLLNKIPSLVAGVITGSSIGGGGIGQFGAGAAFGAATMAAAAAATGGSMFAAGASNAVVDAKTSLAAIRKGGESGSHGMDTVGSIWGSSKSNNAGSSDSGYTLSDNTPPYKSIRESRPDFQRAMEAVENASRIDRHPTTSENDGENGIPV